MRQARRCANAGIEPSRHPARAGPSASENPDSAMKTITAKRPYTSQAAQNGAGFAG
jgi:hypothetical protein